MSILRMVARKHIHKLVVLLSIVHLVDVWLKEVNQAEQLEQWVLPTDVAQRHEDPDFFHNLFYLMLPLSPDTFASNLPMFDWVKSQMYCSKRTSAKALRSNNISSYALPRRQGQ
jgi:hypothetical protein